MDIFEKPHRIQIPNRKVSTAVTLSSQTWILGTIDGVLLRLELDMERQSFTVTSERSVTADDLPESPDASASSFSITRISTLRLDEGEILLVAYTYHVDNVPRRRGGHLMLSPSLKTMFYDEPAWIETLCVRSMRMTASTVFQRLSAGSRIQRIVVVVDRKLMIFGADDEESTVEFTDRASLDVPEVDPSRRNPIEFVEVGGVDGRTLCLLDHDGAVFAKLSRDTRAIAVEAVVPSSRSPLSRDEPRSEEHQTGPVEAVVKFLMRGPSPSEIVRVPIAVSLPRDRWILYLNESVRVVSSTGADMMNELSPESSTEQKELSLGRLSAAIRIGPYLVTRNQGSRSIAIRPAQLWQAPRNCPSLQIIDMENPRASLAKFSALVPHVPVDKDDLVAFYAIDWMSSGHSVMSSFNYRRPLRHQLDSLVESQNLSLALALASDELPALEQKIHMRLAATALGESRHREALDHIRMANVEDPLQVALDLRAAHSPTSWMATQEAATAWADFLFGFALRRARFTLPSASRDPKQTLNGYLAALEALCSSDVKGDRIEKLVEEAGSILSVEECEGIISGPKTNLPIREQNKVLLTVYRLHVEHNKALLILETGPEGSVEDVLSYLETMTASPMTKENVQVLFEHLPYVIAEAGKDRAIDFLTQGNVGFQDSIEFLQRRTGRASEMLLAYLDHIRAHPFAAVNVDSNAVARLLITEVCEALKLRLDQSVDVDEALSTDESVMDLRRTLRCYVDELDTHVDFDETFLDAFPEKLYEERAQLLWRMGRPREAVRMLLFEGHLVDDAVKHCATLPRAERLAVLNDAILFSLEPALVAFGATESRNLETAASFVSRFPEFDFADAPVFQDLPPHTSMAVMKPIIMRCLEAAETRLRQTQIRRSLLRSEIFRLRCELVEERSRSVAIDRETLCHVCRRHIGDSIFALYPGGSVAHYACHGGGRRARDP